MTGLFRTTLEVDQTEDGLVLDFSLENISGTDLEYYSGSSQKYDYIVYNSKNDEVYRWSNNMCFLSVIKETLHKGENLHSGKYGIIPTMTETGSRRAVLGNCQDDRKDAWRKSGRP